MYMVLIHPLVYALLMTVLVVLWIVLFFYQCDNEEAHIVKRVSTVVGFGGVVSYLLSFHRMYFMFGSSNVTYGVDVLQVFVTTVVNSDGTERDIVSLTEGKQE